MAEQQSNPTHNPLKKSGKGKGKVPKFLLTIIIIKKKAI